MPAINHVAMLKTIQDWQRAEADLENRERDQEAHASPEHPRVAPSVRYGLPQRIRARRRSHHLAEERETWDGPRFSSQSAVFGRDGETSVFTALSALDCAWDALTGLPLEVIRAPISSGGTLL